MVKQPVFSVILPTYNRADMLPRAIRSVIGQSFQDWELIIIDDGSTDDTSAVVKEFSDARITYLYQENAERSVARNRGIDYARGEYICFLDSDDFYLPGHLNDFYKKISESPERITFLFSELFQEENEILNLPEAFDFKYNTPFEFVLQKVIGPPQVCVYAEVLKEFQFNPKLTVGEDLNLWLRILVKYPSITATGSRTLGVGIHNGRSVNILLHNNYKASLRSFKETIKDHKIKSGISRKLIRTMYCESYFGMGKYYMFQKRKWPALIRILVSWLIMPKYQLKFKLNLMYCLVFDFKKAMGIVM